MRHDPYTAERRPCRLCRRARCPDSERAAVAAFLVLTACTSQGTPTAASPAAPPSGGPAGPPSGGSAGPPPTGASGVPPASGAPSPTGAPPAGSGRCSAAVLRGTVQPRDAAAGNRYADLVVTNTGPAPCTLYGYGGLLLLDAAGRPLPTNALRDEAPGPALVTVAPNGTAAKLLHWGVVPTGTEPADRPCQPAPARLSIIPPDETQPFTVAWDLGPVCAGGTIHGSAYHAP